MLAIHTKTAFDDTIAFSGVFLGRSNVIPLWLYYIACISEWGVSYTYSASISKV
jgi:hypothetical protein